jgi:glycosyltransferase involved in cell wall biosynthesis
MEDLDSPALQPQARLPGVASPALIVTGAHRSGTSVVAQALGWAGVYLGDNMKVPSVHNPDGYFEDLDIVSFHDDVLRANGAMWDAPWTLQHLSLPPEFERRAAELLAHEFAGRPLWGWKDPRTTLFLEFWAGLLPSARWLFTVRRPAEVVTSMLTRGDLRRYAANPLRRASLALQLWVEYYRRILQFAHTHPQDCLLLWVPDDLAERRAGQLDHVLTHEWGLPLQGVDLAKVYMPTQMKHERNGWVRLLAQAHRPSQALYAELQQWHQQRWNGVSEVIPASTVGRQAAPPVSTSRRKVCLICPQEFAYSQTFVRDHAHWLPADVRVLYGGTRRTLGSDNESLTGMLLLDMLMSGSEFPNRRADGHRLLPAWLRAVELAWARGLGHAGQQPLGEIALRRYLHSQGVEVVLAEFGPTGARVARACREASIPLVVHFHGADAYKPRWTQDQRNSYKDMFQLATAFVAVSRHTIEQLAGLGAPRERIFWNSCGVDVDCFQGGNPAAAPPTFLSVGRFVEKKGPHLTLLAFGEVFRHCPQARLVMIGDGPLLDACRQLAAALGLGQAVQFAGVRSRLDVALWMRQARAFVLHSIQATNGDMEGTPVSVLEAAASGLPVVSTRHGGIPEAVRDGQTGFLVEEGDVAGMAKRMSELVESPALAAELGRAAREHMIGNYAMPLRIAGLMEILEWAIAHRR